MKRTTLSACLAAVCVSSSAFAQSSVQLTGLVEMYAGSMQLVSAERTRVVGSGAFSTSWWGMHDTEDLGNGLKAGFQLGAFFRGDDGSAGRFNGDTYFARDANVSLSGGFGSIKLLRSSAPNLLSSVFANPIAPVYQHFMASAPRPRWGMTTSCPSSPVCMRH